MICYFAQTRLALLRILSDLVEDDFFGIITFDGSISLWKRELVQATPANVRNAKTFVQNIHEGGGKDFDEGLDERGSRMKTGLC